MFTDYCADTCPLNIKNKCLVIDYMCPVIKFIKEIEEKKNK